MESRRQFLRRSAIGLTLPFAYKNLIKSSTPQESRIVLTEEALKLHKSSLVFDCHNDLPHKMFEKGFSSFQKFDLTQNQLDFQTDIPRLKLGGVNAQFWVACGWLSGNVSEDKSSSFYCLEDIELIHQMVEKYRSVFEIALSSEDILRIRKKGLIASLIGVEGGLAIDNSLKLLDTYYRLGARYMTLTWGQTNSIADSATDKPQHNGLSGLGREVLSEMNRIGMMVDISHVSFRTMEDVLERSKSPIIASHSSSYALASITRNVPDDIIKEITRKGGIICVNFFPGYLTLEGVELNNEYWKYYQSLESDGKYSETQIQKLLDQWDFEHPTPMCSIEKVIDHIEHIINVAGIDSVGLGSDFDGIPFGPENLSDVSFFPYITQALIDRGYKEKEVQKILGENLFQVLQRTEESSAKI